MQRPGPLSEASAIVVPHGGTVRLAEALTSTGVVDRPWLFRGAAWLTRREGTLHSAEFAFPAHASIRQVLAILRTAHPVEHHLTIAEGLTAQQIIAVLGRAEAMTGEVRRIDEGAVLPQTYNYEYGADRAEVVARAKAAMDKDLAAAWADRAPGLPLSSARDALILASIVERETAKPEERPHVAAVYLNRLRQGMKLQADPTVVYLASNGAGVLDHRLTRAELGRDDPFNTYRSPGLPPAPICSPGLDSLHAVLHPAASDDLFFVADGTGGHVFSRSYEAHGIAVARWRALVPSAPHGSPD
ncbi:MAG: endolytic transglycosylase MltG [Rhodopila sp.]|nr:endolytic transglycosylase MltG [Rhodopila sp.]